MYTFRGYVDCYFFQAEGGIRDTSVTGVQTCALPISESHHEHRVSRSGERDLDGQGDARVARRRGAGPGGGAREALHAAQDRKSTRLNSSHRCISYAVFCLKKKTT